MCAIIDNDVVAQAFGDKITPAGRAFRDSLDQGKLQLVVGGLLVDELDQNGTSRKWRAIASPYGRVHTVARRHVEPLTSQLRTENSCVSNDEHVIALAQVSGARLLVSNDLDLHVDFKNKGLIDGPRGKVFSTHKLTSFTRGHRDLLDDSTLCDMAK